jgi:hypothetical protein
MIKQYVVTVEYPDHYIPLDKAQFQSILWDGLALLPREAVRVEEIPLAEPPRKDKHGCMFGDYP